MNRLIFAALLLPLLGAVLCRLFGKKEKPSALFFVTSTALETGIAAFIYVYQASHSVLVTVPDFAGIGLSFGADGFRALYVFIAAFLWLMTSVFALEYLEEENRSRYFFYNLITLSGVAGVFLSADFFTAFVFFEIMSFASYPLVVHEEDPGAMRAGETYLGVAVISGMILLVGVFFLNRVAGTVSYDALRAWFASGEMSKLGFAGGLLILLGFGAKAGMYPLHIWLPEAHPVAPAPASALLSGVLTKCGVFGIIVLTADVFSGNPLFGKILLALAVITMFLGALLALFSVNLKRTLACSSMSQIGFILVGVSFTLLLGGEGGIAESGALLHMVNHSQIKLVLFMCAGTVAMNIHALDLNDIRGFGRKKPFLAVIFLIGALSIGGIPFFGGYVSKTLIHESIVEFIKIEQLAGTQLVLFKTVEWIFLISGGLTVCYMTKLFVCLFVEKNENPAKQAEFDRKTGYLSPLSRFVFALSSLPLIVIGILPNLATEKITKPAAAFFGTEPLGEEVAFFGWECLSGGLISIGIGFGLYFLLVRNVFIKDAVYRSLWPAALNLETNLYRPLIVGGTLGFIRYIAAPLAYLFEWILIDGVLWFTLTVCRFFALLFDRIIAFLCKTALKPHIYRFREETMSMRFGELLDRLVYRNRKHRFAERMDSFTDTVGRVLSAEYTSFSFAFAMISLGIMIVLLFAVFA